MDTMYYIGLDVHNKTISCEAGHHSSPSEHHSKGRRMPEFGSKETLKEPFEVLHKWRSCEPTDCATKILDCPRLQFALASRVQCIWSTCVAHLSSKPRAELMMGLTLDKPRCLRRQTPDVAACDAALWPRYTPQRSVSQLMMSGHRQPTHGHPH